MSLQSRAALAVGVDVGLGLWIPGQKARSAHRGFELALGGIEASVVRVPFKDVLDAVAIGALVEALDALEALLDPGEEMVRLVLGHDVAIQSEGFESGDHAKAKQRFALVEVGLYAFK